MEVSGVVYRSLPRAGIDDHSVLSPSRVVGFSNRVGDGNLRFSGSRVRKYLQSGFSDAGYLKYYSNSRRPEIIICGGGGPNIDEEVKDEKKKNKKLMKKRSKLLKALSKNVDFGLDPADNRHALLDQIKGNMMSDATELLITQLRQQLKAEEKVLKRKRKEVKARKKAELMQKNSEGASTTSSSSSSESSDSECGEVVDMTRLQNQVLAPPVVNESQQSTPVSSMGRDIIVENQLRHKELDSVSRINNVSILGGSGSCDQPSVAENKIEVCMGGKCKKSGAASLIEEFNKVLGSNVGGSVVGCKCMGKCRSAPNVRVLNSSTSSSEAQTDQQGTPTKSLCIGVGLDDVSTIVANLLGQTHSDVGGFAASAASWSGAM